MKSIIKRGSSKLGGLLFRHPDLTYYTFHEWIEAGCPSDCYVMGTPDQMVICNIPIVDARFDTGVFHRITPTEPKQCKWKVPSYMRPKKTHSTREAHYDFITYYDVSRRSEKTVLRYGS